jgi:hypothetical protein
MSLRVVYDCECPQAAMCPLGPGQTAPVTLSRLTTVLATLSHPELGLWLALSCQAQRPRTARSGQAQGDAHCYGPPYHCWANAIPVRGRVCALSRRGRRTTQGHWQEGQGKPDKGPRADDPSNLKGSDSKSRSDPRWRGEGFPRPESRIW